MPYRLFRFLLAPEHKRHEFLSGVCNSASGAAELVLERTHMIIGQRMLPSFIALDEEGDSHLMHVYVDLLDVSTPTNPEGVSEGTHYFWTGNDSRVARLAKGRYRIFKTGDVLVSDDPAAP